MWLGNTCREVVCNAHKDVSILTFYCEPEAHFWSETPDRPCLLCIDSIHRPVLELTNRHGKCASEAKLKYSSHYWVVGTRLEPVWSNTLRLSIVLTLGPLHRLLHPADLFLLYSKTCKCRYSLKVTGNTKALQQSVQFKIAHVTSTLAPMFAYCFSLQCHNRILSWSARILASFSALHWLFHGEGVIHYFIIHFRTFLKFT